MKKNGRKVLDITIIAVTVLVFTFMFGSAFNAIKSLDSMNLGNRTAVVEETETNSAMAEGSQTSNN